MLSVNELICDRHVNKWKMSCVDYAINHIQHCSFVSLLLIFSVRWTVQGSSIKHDVISTPAFINSSRKIGSDTNNVFDRTTD